MLTVHVVVLFLGPAQIMNYMFLRSGLDADLSKWKVQPTARVAGMFVEAPLSNCNKRALASSSTWSNVQPSNDPRYDFPSARWRALPCVVQKQRRKPFPHGACVSWFRKRHHTHRGPRRVWVWQIKQNRIDQH